MFGLSFIIIALLLAALGVVVKLQRANASAPSVRRGYQSWNPGWYPDPDVPTAFRWWDGRAWSLREEDYSLAEDRQRLLATSTG